MVPYLTPLDPEAQRAAGVPEPWPFAWADRVRFYEIDALDHVNNTAYLRWFETIRVDHVKALGITAYTAQSSQVVLKAVEAQYHKPVLRHESYIVTSRAASFRRTSFRMEYAVWAPDLRAEGSALVVLLDLEGAKIPIPEAARAALIAEGAVAEG